MQALKSLLRQPKKQQAKIVPVPATRQPTPLTPAELKAVAGGLPRGTWQVNALAE